MRQAKYFDKDLYSKFHRKHDGIAMIDVDSVEICQRKGCWKVLAIIEHLYDVNQTKKKYTNIVEEIGRALNVPVFWSITKNRPEIPFPSELLKYTPLELH